MDRTQYVSVAAETPAPVGSLGGHLRVLVEVVQADLLRQWEAGAPARLTDYAADFPELFADPAAVQALTLFAARHRPRADDRHLSAPTNPLPAGRVAHAWAASGGGLTDFGSGPVAGSASDPDQATRPADGDRSKPPVFPAVGDRFLGFSLTEELGRGAFARVFLAVQHDLSDRPVALKVTGRPTREPQRLARLRHTNIVPIYSVHDKAPLQAVCMPFLGRRTLADLIKSYKATGSLPVESHVTTVAQAHGSTLRSAPDLALPTDAPPAADPAHAATAWEGLVKLGHADRVLWIVTRLADGLAHAHDTGILHLDLKPANVLFGDDGQPMLLDFNLSYDLAADDRERAGGTLAYMAPEQLEEYRDGGPTRVDRRTDLYGLGVIFFELLTGKHPFPVPRGRPNLTQLAAARRVAPPDPRAVDPAVSPAVAAVIRKLLAPDPADRYQSAHDLLCDLERQRDHRPLKFAPDRSVRERVAKWRARNPRAVLHLAIVGLALAAVGGGVAAARQSNARALAEATTRADQTVAAVNQLRVGLTDPDSPARRAKGRAAGAAVLAAYGLPESTDWTAHRNARPLAPVVKQAVGDALGELALLMAHSERVDGSRERALAWNRAAEACFAGRPVPRVLAEQRRALDPAAAPPAAVADADTPIDLFVRGVKWLADGRYPLAVQLLDQLVDRDPGHFAGQFVLGRCLAEVPDHPRALERLRMANAIAPADPRPTYHRGLLFVARQDYTAAEKEFTAALAKDDGFADAYRHRGIARLKTGDHRGAVADLTRALELGDSAFQVRLFRAEAYAKLGDADAAARDRAAADGLAPAGPSDYLTRGLFRVPTDPAAALADFRKADDLFPGGYVQAMQAQAHVLADALNRPETALAALNRLIESAPDFALGRSGRAVVLARLGRATEAHEEAEKAMLLSADPIVTYQAGCAYALTSKDRPDDRERAIELVRKALRDGYRNLEAIRADADLATVRDLPAIKAALDAAEKLAK
jgi:serine/threonine protein kinase/tetratricopeptide (TPR) repeat protein